MKVVIAPDSFKGNMRSATVCGIIKDAILREMPDAEVLTFPMADGGEGTVDAVVAAHRDKLRMIRGKMVYDLLPRIDWDKGKAVLYLLDALGLNRHDIVPVYLGDDLTDEDAFRALRGRGVGIFVGRADDPEVANRTTAADYILHSVEEVQAFLDSLAR